MSITLSSPSLSLTLKILLASRLSIKGIMFSCSICYYFFLMPPSLASMRHTALITLILSISKVIPSCSYCIKKGLVYIVIMAPSGYQPLSYIECIKVNICLSCNVYSISTAKYIYYFILFSRLVPYLSYYRVLNLIYC